MAQGLKSGIDRNNMDFNVRPGENFYEYAAGNWMKTHPLDKEHPMNGAFVDLEELNKKRIREMVEDYAGKPQTKGTVAQKIASLYNENHDLYDYVDGAVPTTGALPLVCVPTTGRVSSAPRPVCSVTAFQISSPPMTAHRALVHTPTW